MRLKTVNYRHLSSIMMQCEARTEEKNKALYTYPGIVSRACDCRSSQQPTCSEHSERSPSVEWIQQLAKR